MMDGLAKATDTIEPKTIYIWLDRVILTESNGIHYQLAGRTIVFLPGVSDERCMRVFKIVTPLGEAFKR